MTTTDRSPTWLLEHRFDRYSQSGEDGVLAKVLETLPENDRWCVELGASDGIQASNSRHLIEQRDYRGVLIEANPRKFAALRRNYPDDGHAHLIQRKVGLEGTSCLDQVLAETAIPKDFDLLVLDVDGNDYHIWASLTIYQPKVVCVEFNPTIPTEVRFVQQAKPDVSQGSSLLSLTELAQMKGYELVSVLPLNAVYVQREFFPLFGISDNRPAALRTDTSLITHFFIGYDGTIFLDGHRRLPWHGLSLKASKFQYLPRILRKFSGDYSYVHWLLFLGYAFIRDPRWAWAEFKRRWSQHRSK